MLRQLRDHAVAPFGGGDLAADDGADLPVQIDQRGIDGLHRALTGSDDTPAQLLALVSAGKLGKKTGTGYYTWLDGKAIKARVYDIPEELTQRLIKPLLTATQRCISAGVVDDPDLADAGIIFGTGFSPWTGGPMNHTAQKGQPA